jgi:hypothetical protein
MLVMNGLPPKQVVEMEAATRTIDALKSKREFRKYEGPLWQFLMLHLTPLPKAKTIPESGQRLLKILSEMAQARKSSERNWKPGRAGA